ncbi:MAG: hypothetical protein ACPGJS_18600 [Flammeovirgaceae bacterium]
MNIFLKAKHWQLFVLLFGIPMAGQFLMIAGIVSNANQVAPEIYGNTREVSNQMNLMFKIFPFLMLILVGTFGGWLWAIGTGLQHRIPDHLKINITRFKLFTIIPFSYIIVLSFSMMAIQQQLMLGINPAIFILMFVLHIFSMFCILHTMYYVAKTLKTVELQREASFSDFIGEFLLIWVFPIGIWIIQPKVNKMVAA